MNHIKEIASLFFKLGLVAFGGPAAHIAMMEEEVVEKRQWMSREHFLDLVGATNLIPGPNSTEMAIHCGFHRGGWPGLFTAGFCFIFPAVTLTGLLAFIYVEYGSVPNIEPLFWGIRPAVLAIIISAIMKLGKKALKSWVLGVIGAFVVAGVLMGVSEVVAILAGGVLGMLILSMRQPSKQGSIEIFLVFFKLGLILFGSGYVLVAYLQGEIVEKLGWINHSELLDAIAMGQLTPGPVLSTATFVGYQIAGWQGAILATLGIFLPSFFLVAMLNPLIPKMRKSPWTSKFLDAVNVSAVGVMVAVVLKLAVSTVVDWKSALIALLSIFVVFVFKKFNVIYLVLASAMLGYVLQFV